MLLRPDFELFPEGLRVVPILFGGEVIGTELLIDKGS